MVDTRPANDCYFTDDEVAACVDEGAYITVGSITEF